MDTAESGPFDDARSRLLSASPPSGRWRRFGAERCRPRARPRSREPTSPSGRTRWIPVSGRHRRSQNGHRRPYRSWALRGVWQDDGMYFFFLFAAEKLIKKGTHRENTMINNRVATVVTLSRFSRSRQSECPPHQIWWRPVHSMRKRCRARLTTRTLIEIVDATVIPDKPDRIQMIPFSLSPTDRSLIIVFFISFFVLLFRGTWCSTLTRPVSVNTKPRCRSSGTVTTSSARYLSRYTSVIFSVHTVTTPTVPSASPEPRNTGALGADPFALTAKPVRSAPRPSALDPASMW